MSSLKKHLTSLIDQGSIGLRSELNMQILLLS